MPSSLQEVPRPVRRRTFVIAWLLALVVLLATRASAQAPQPATARPPDSYLYIEPYQVRHEMLMPLAVLESLVPVARADAAVLEPAEQTAAAEILGVFFSTANAVRIDGIDVPAESTRVVFMDKDVQTINVGAPPERLDASRAFVGIIASYDTKGVAAHVSMAWTCFNDAIRTVRSTVYNGDAAERGILTVADATVSWTREGEAKLPALDVVPEPTKDGWFGRSRIHVDDAQARAVFEPLLRNIYRSFDYRAESAVYDALARSVSGDLLADLYLAIRRSLELEGAGGPVSRIEEVAIESGKRADLDGDRSGFAYDATWTVRGRVEHWGHVHNRLNRYGAAFDVEVVDGAWKISRFQVTSQQTVEAVTRPRDEANRLQ